MGRKRGSMTYEVVESKNHPGFWYAIKYFDGKRQGNVENPNPIEGMRNYLFASQKEATDAAVEAGYKPS